MSLHPVKICEVELSEPVGGIAALSVEQHVKARCSATGMSNTAPPVLAAGGLASTGGNPAAAAGDGPVPWPVRTPPVFKSLVADHYPINRCV
jgi:hypothetical protein